MMTEYKKFFYAEILENPEFSDQELKRIGISFINGIEELETGVKNLGVDNFDKSISLSDYGLTLSKIGSITDPTWAIYKSEVSLDFISDLWNKKNFYTLYSAEVSKPDTLTKVYSKAHLREGFIEEDMEYYINLHLDLHTAPNQEGSGYLN